MNSLLGESKERNLEQKCNSHFGTNSTPTKHYHPSYLYTNEKKSGGGVLLLRVFVVISPREEVNEKTNSRGTFIAFFSTVTNDF